MDKSIRYLVILLIYINFISCTGQSKTQMIITNCTNQKIDSLIIWNIFSKKSEKIFNINANDTIKRIYKYNYLDLPKGENGVLSIASFKEDYYYLLSNGFIGFPTAKVEDNYEFYIYDYGIVTKKGLIPLVKIEKHKISEFIE